MCPKFDWDDTKAASNLAKHGVSFEEARTAFDDPWSIETFDEEHSHHEFRARVLGVSAGGRLLSVVVTDRAGKIRIITARRATPTERCIYEEG